MYIPPLEEVTAKLRDAVAPAFTASVVVLAPFLVILRGRLAPLGAALAIAAGLAAGNFYCESIPWRPKDIHREWVLVGAGIALAAGMLARVPKLPGVVGWLLRAAGAGCAAWLVVSPDLRAAHPWSVYAFGAVVLALWAVLELLAAESPGGAVPLAACATSFVAAGVLMQASFASMTDVAAITTAALFGIAVAAWLRPGDVGGAMPAIAVLAPTILLAGRFDTDSGLPVSCFLLAGLAPLALLPLLIPPFRRWSPLRRGILGVVLLLTPLTFAVVQALRAPVAEG